MTWSRSSTGRTRPRVVLDSGGASALGGRSREARARLRWLLEEAGEVVVPAVILAECTTGSGPRDAETNRVIKRLLAGREPVPADETRARLAGALRFGARAGDGIDALVAAEAALTGSTCVVLTSDPDDLGALLAGHPRVRVRRS